MKKILLLCAVASTVAFYACKKDSATDTNTPTPQDTVAAPAIDPVALASSVKIGYGGTSVTGTFPVTTTATATPVLDSIYNGRVYSTVNNRYVVIYPRVRSGFISGYYLKINGADSYFKIDYTAAYGVRKASHKNQGARDEVNNIDSSIVIKLPAGLKGDTFSIKYAAYDSLNNVSNTITAIVNVIASADSTNDALLLGSWHYTAYKNYETDEWAPITEEDSSSINYFTCVEGKLVTLWGEENTNNIPVIQYRNTYTYNLQFSAKNAYQQIYYQNYRSLDLDLSSCSNYIYTSYSESSDIYSGGYAYNATTKAITLIHDENGTGDNITTVKYTVKEITSTTLSMYLVSTGNNNHDALSMEYYQFTKN
jgi:hypothetical protein